MNLALNDPINGSYASGKLKIGVKGDFVTSPSLGKEFCNQLVSLIAELSSTDTHYIRCIKPNEFKKALSNEEHNL